MTIASRVQTFCEAYGLQMPILLAPMAGACPVALSQAVARAGGMGACGALLMSPDAISDWARQMRAGGNGAFQMNLWVPDPPPERDPEAEAAVRGFLGQWGPEVDAKAAEVGLQDFAAQVDAVIDTGPSVISSIMGVYDEETVKRLKDNGIRWFATVTTVAEALEAEAAGADAVVAQGSEAGGHRGAFHADRAEAQMIGLFSLLPAVVDAVKVPVIATGGIADARGIAAALTLGASAVQIGTGFLRTPEAGTPTPWADALGRARPEDTAPTRAFSGRLGRSLRTAYTEAAATPEAPKPAPYPIQRNLTGAMRNDAAQAGDLDRMQAWAGQSAALGATDPAEEVTDRLWSQARELLNLSTS
ncbi:NAD(P)H-dependent flavin oxidoreductase [Arenibacterium halophilum]|uniref:Propionate 3-nitronate monooxygenase n=1 Tax=Arenibacterium halophilum TaxID=2583821 RepID=A0ABY2XEG3_9RHOB|nr:nitronate monooxygenase [Arenibacterium halophilum]TMV15091.1 nitronate monooxygenase [Arenibacterium halophilum]